MKLSKSQISSIKKSEGLIQPVKDIFDLPEKILQFGTGVLLRGLPDIIINEAINEGKFKGRILVVKSTSNGDTDEFDKQNGLYTVCLRGIDNGVKIEQDQIVGSISRVLSASTEWELILDAASNPEMQIVISNTTEVGITLTKDNVHANPPQSFPGKLLAFLYRRFKIFEADASKGMIIIPTELIPANGEKLLSIVLELAHQNGLETAFLDWVENSNYFLNSLVDRIVPGEIDKTEKSRITERLGYDDGLMIMSETYKLWAIQSGNEKIRSVLSFAYKNSGVIIEPDINKYRELKLRLLNGSHSFTCGLAMLAGFQTVKEAMDSGSFVNFIRSLMFEGIIPSLNKEIVPAEAEKFAYDVLDRYRNPFIEHKWQSISTQYSSKMYLRNLQTIKKFYEKFGYSSKYMALGMAGFILYMKTDIKEDGIYYSKVNGNEYPVSDENAALISDIWNRNGNEAAKAILSSQQLWEEDLNTLNGFGADVSYWLDILVKQGAVYAMEHVCITKTVLANEK